MPQAPTVPLILAADVGGTNLSLALLERGPDGYRRLSSWRGATRAESSLLAPAQRFLKECAREGHLTAPTLTCVSGAGPVQAGRIILTNAPWDIEAAALEQGLGMPVHLVNDFTAVAHGVLLLDPDDGDQLQALAHGDGSRPRPQPEATALIVGAGTGLGVGYVTRAGGRTQVWPSEGGHITLPVTSEESYALACYLRAGRPAPADAEQAVSGPGIANLLAFLLDTGRAPASPATEAVLALPHLQRPPLIAAQAEQDPACGRALELFVELYARVCADLCAVFLPLGGLYLAGGIAAKNSAWFTNEQRFMRIFEQNCREHLNQLTRTTPVFVVRDYGISLPGAAHAGWLAQSPPAQS